MKTRDTGMTLPELLVAIAIIGILASIIMTNLSEVRKRSRIETSLAALEQVRAAAMMCAYRMSNLNTPSKNGYVCPQSDIRWPMLNGAWVYKRGTNPKCVPEDTDLDVSNGTFSYCAEGDNTKIVCTQTGSCIKSP